MSSPHHDTGKKGEILAACHLERSGYTILHRNWRVQHYEIDIIAVKNDVLHFIEVKTRRNRNFGFPEEKVDRKKLQSLMNASERYLEDNPGWKRIQYDILAISLLGNQQPEILLIEDVYLYD